MGMIHLFLTQPIVFLLIAIPLLYSVILHELAHGWVAWRLGDPTAKMAGRLSLNPLKHLDPIGTLMLFILGFGWAKPVPVNFARLSNGSKGVIMVSAAGILTNMALAFFAIFVQRLLAVPLSGKLGVMLYYMAQINIILAAFNLIPIPPLDGSKILMGAAPGHIRESLLRIEPYGFFIIIGLLYFGILDPVIDFFRWIILSFIKLLLP
jgi:Zn-dependent protease